MKDYRNQQLAHNVVNYSLCIRKNENLLIEVEGHENLLVKAIVEETYKAGGNPFVTFIDNEILAIQLKQCTSEQIKLMSTFDQVRMNEMDAYLLIRADLNTNELNDVDVEKMDYYWKNYYHEVHAHRWSNTKWCIMSYPNASAAQRANMSTEKFEDLYFKVCNLDYSKLALQMSKLVDLLKRTETVRIEGPGCDLSMSIKNMPVSMDAGHQNLPDGEVYCIPRKDSINGYISFNTPVTYQGTTFENIKFTFKDGKIEEATANDTEKMNLILNTDQGSRYIGEFGIGLNPYITNPMKDILFDEKIWGSIHLAVGSAPIQGENTNLSSIHWDIVHIQRPEYGGGQLWFDDVLVRQDGYFVFDELKGLNPENF
ncbi:aminopeptidase [Paenibacillus sp. KQZ6P-2]|uniref:Aminopeptidase n=1 Tax=Paenibacillus mangrovi TaxID=2931978 RepID=A0A9X1WKY2_9BACL|nr:aminopeptidase [Paenibacillus mangrovi]MCJ8010794.1 aminopeptidase [Paenibacillus mangrovi]